MSIELSHISKSFGSYQALRDVSLSIHDGELVALLGPSGSGKTTLLRIIAGLDTPNDDTRSRIRFYDEDVAHRPAAQRRVGFVFQHYALFRHMSVFENVAFGLRVRAAQRAAGERRNRSPRARAAGARAARRPRQAVPVAAFRRPAATGRAGPGAGRRAARCCCSTSRSARSTPRCGKACGPGSAGCTTRFTSRASWSRTTRKKRSKWPTASS